MKFSISKVFAVAIFVPAMFFGKNAQACSIDPMLGSMCVFAGNFAPRGFALAQGQLLAINSNQALFSLLGTTYGGDGRTSFGLPDTRGRVLIGQGQGPGLQNYRLGQKGGAELVTLSILQVPSHGHGASTTVNNNVTVTGVADLKAVDARSNSNSPAGKALAQSPGRDNIYSTTAPTVNMHADSIDLNLSGQVNSTASTTVLNSGGSQSHENRMPFITVNWIIATVGIYPSRS